MVNAVSTQNSCMKTYANLGILLLLTPQLLQALHKHPQTVVPAQHKADAQIPTTIGLIRKF